MRFSQDIDTSQHFVRGYGPGWIKINEQEIRRSLIVTPERLIVDWPPQAFADLEGAHFEAIAQLEPEIVVPSAPDAVAAGARRGRGGYGYGRRLSDLQHRDVGRPPGRGRAAADVRLTRQGSRRGDSRISPPRRSRGTFYRKSCENPSLSRILRNRRSASI